MCKAQQLAQQLAEETGWIVRGSSLEVAAREGDVVVSSLPYSACTQWLQQLQGELRGKIILDIKNPFWAIKGQTSGVEENAKALGIPARWVAVFKTNFWTTLEQPVNKDDVARNCFYCGDDQGAKQVVAELIEQIGYRPVDCGDLKAAWILDLMMPLMIELDRRFGGKAQCSWKLLD